MLELLVVVAVVVMLDILELIMEIVPNYPTILVSSSGEPSGSKRHVSPTILTL
jgi:hypothetical protein